jgi:TonB family protein
MFSTEARASGGTVPSSAPREATTGAFGTAAPTAVVVAPARSVENASFQGTPVAAEPVRQGVVRQGGFKQSTPKPVTASGKAASVIAPQVPVEIVSKVTPAYTEEARLARIEGEVVLEVVFAATGRIQILRVLAGLGHGLDEEAVKAAREIRFKSAKIHGKPVDHKTTLRVVFRLA